MSLYLCVDCGGSKTAVVICDAAGTILSRASGGPSNFAYIGMSVFLTTVRAAVSAALSSIHPPPPSTTLPPPAPLFAAAWLGVSGVDSPAAVAQLTPPLAALLGTDPVVCNDTHLLAAPMQLYSDVSAAIACVSGTGGIVASFRENKSGSGAGEVLQELGRVGGWGWILGDEGGGFHVGREAVRRVLQEADRESIEAPEEELPPTGGSHSASAKPHTLRDRILDWFGITDVYELLTVIHFADPEVETDDDRATDSTTPLYMRMKREKRLSSLAPIVFSAAFEADDPLAMSVLRTASDSLADQINVFLHAETEDPGKTRKVRSSESILCFGGSLAGVEEFRMMVLDELASRGHAFKRVEVVKDASAVGAQALAMRARQKAA